MANELRAVRTWLDATLTGDATLQATLGRRWYWNVAPPTDPRTKNGPRYPLGIYRKVASRDFWGVGAYRILSIFRMGVTVVRIAGQADIAGAVTRLDQLLQDVPVQSVVVDAETYWIAGSTRRESIGETREEQGVLYEYEGGIYEVTVSR